MSEPTLAEPRPALRPWALFAIGTVLLLAGGLGGWFYESSRAAPTAKAEIETVVRDYILAHPEILPEAMERLRARETAQQLSGVGDDIEKPYPGMVLGNPNGSVTLVEFTDFACTYCRRSVSDVEAVIAEHPELKVVIRELPIISALSPDAAKMAMAAAEQGKYPAFHKLMFAAGRVDALTIEAAARAAGLDLERAKRVISDPRSQAELARNIEMARQLGFDGTPSWVIGDQILSGAVGREELSKAIAAAKEG
jgi:protein-disulfide isomerase